MFGSVKPTSSAATNDGTGYQLVFHVDRIRSQEIMFQPSIIGVDQVSCICTPIRECVVYPTPTLWVILG